MSFTSRSSRTKQITPACRLHIRWNDPAKRLCILLTLMRAKGKVVSREKLMEVLWETDDFVDEAALTVNVGRLRKKLDAAGLNDFIATKHGVGYLIGD